MKKAIVICGFPGIGKSKYFNDTNNLKVLDSDSSKFSWIGDPNNKERNTSFPVNYIKHIKFNLELVDVILVSTHNSVIKALCEEGIEHYIVYPTVTSKDEYLKRYTKRGSPKEFIDHMSDNWDTFIHDIIDSEKSNLIRLAEGRYLSDVMADIIVKPTITLYNIREFEIITGILISNGYSFDCVTENDTRCYNLRKKYNIIINKTPEIL